MSESRNISAGLRARMALEKFGFHFSHALGQNFILDDALIARIVEAADIRPGEDVLEIGPGAGVMTRHMADAGARVTAIELDKSLEPVLGEVLSGAGDVRVVFGDAMKLDAGALMEGKPYRVVANLPYYITTDVILRFLTAPAKPESITVMVQKEAAERMTAAPGGKTWCALSVIVRYFCQAEPLLQLPPEAFTPRPHVDSTLLGLRLHSVKPVQAADEGMFLRVVNAAFAMRRKTLVNNLCAAFSMPREQAEGHMAALGLDARVRGEALSVDMLARLADLIAQAS